MLCKKRDGSPVFYLLTFNKKKGFAVPSFHFNLSKRTCFLFETDIFYVLNLGYNQKIKNISKNLTIHKKYDII